MRIRISQGLSSLPIIICSLRGIFKELGLKVEFTAMNSFENIYNCLSESITDCGEVTFAHSLNMFGNMKISEMQYFPIAQVSSQQPILFSIFNLDEMHKWEDDSYPNFFFPVISDESVERYYTGKLIESSLTVKSETVSISRVPYNIIEKVFYLKDCLGIVGDYLTYPFLSNLQGGFQQYSAKTYPNTLLCVTDSFLRNNPEKCKLFVSGLKKAQGMLEEISKDELIQIVKEGFHQGYFQYSNWKDLERSISKSFESIKQIYSPEVQMSRITDLAELMSYKQAEIKKLEECGWRIKNIIEDFFVGKLPHIEPEEPNVVKIEKKIEMPVEETSTLNYLNHNIYRVLFEESPEPLIIFEKKGYKIIDANSKFCQETGYNLNELRNMRILELFYEFAKEHPLLKYINSPEETRYISSLDFKHRSGIKLSFDLLLNLIESRENSRFLALFLNNTEQKEAMRLKHEFISNVSHELRTPMTNIQGHLEILATDRKINYTPEHKETISIISRNVVRMNRLITNLLQLGNKVNYSMDQLERFDPSLIIEEVVQINTYMAQEKKLKVSLDLERNLSIDGIKFDFFQVISNLFINAVKYTERGEIVITCNRSENVCQIKVADTGIGFDMKYEYSIFERFFRVPDLANRKVGGTGVGLAIVQETVSKMGGVILVNSEPGKGSTFSVMIPLALY